MILPMTRNETYRRTCRTWISPLAVSSSSSKTARFSTSPASRISDSSARRGCFSRCLHRVLTSTARSDLCKKGRTSKRYTSAVLMAIGVRFEAFHQTFDVKNIQHELGVSVNIRKTYLLLFSTFLYFLVLFSKKVKKVKKRNPLYLKMYLPYLKKK